MLYWSGAGADPAAIHRWWARHPRANIGLACGASGLFVVDLDVKWDVDGVRTWLDLLAGLGLDPPVTPHSITPTGGHHLFFAAPGGPHELRNSQGRLGPGIDGRGQGGFVVLPPSVHAPAPGDPPPAPPPLGGRWSWAPGLEPWQLPVARLPLPVAAMLAGEKAGKVPAYVRAAVEGELGRVAAAVPGTRNTTLNRAAFALGGFVGAGLLERGAVEPALVDAALAVGLPAREAAATARSGLDAGERQPRTVPAGGGHRAAGAGDAVPAAPALDNLLLAEAADDDGNAACVALLYGDRFLYCEAHGWMVYRDMHWRTAGATAALDRAVVDTLRQRRVAAVRADCEPVVKATRASRYNVQATKQMLTSRLPAEAGEFDADPDHLNVANAVVDLRTGAALPHDPHWRFTYRLDVEYDPHADSGDWRAWLCHTLGGVAQPDVARALERYLQLAVGYSLTGHISEEVLFYVYGPPRSGKGTFTEALLALLGYEPLATEVGFGMLTRDRSGDHNSADLAALRPCRLVVAGESGVDQWLNAPEVKRLTGGNRIFAAFKYHDHFSYRPCYKIWLTSNHPPRADAEDPALWSRLHVIPFPVSHVGREDRSLKGRMKRPEMQRQILAWAVEGARLWYAAGPSGMVVPAAVRQETEAARENLDYVGQWLAERVAVTGRDDDFVPNPLLYASYEAWCHEMGTSSRRLTSLTQALKAKGLAAGVQRWHGGRNQRGCAGLRLLSYRPPPAEP